ncbi:MAG: hypothetical protein AB1638_11690 [Nitrospirota bacterium]
MHVNTPRVLELLEEIISELKELQENVSESNPELVGVFDRLIMHIEGQKSELLKGRFSYERISTLMKFIVDLIYIIDKWTNTLYYKVSRLIAISNKIELRRRKCRLGKISNFLGLMPI